MVHWRHNHKEGKWQLGGAPAPFFLWLGTKGSQPFSGNPTHFVLLLPPTVPAVILLVAPLRNGYPIRWGVVAQIIIKAIIRLIISKSMQLAQIAPYPTQEID